MRRKELPEWFQKAKTMSDNVQLKPVSKVTKKPVSSQPIIASPYLRVPGASRYLNVSKRTLLRWVKGHKVPTIKATRRLLLFKRTDLDAAMERLTIEAI